MLGESSPLARLYDLNGCVLLLGVPYLNVFSILEKSNIWIDEARANDGAHPRAAGYAELAKIIESWDAWLNWFK